MIKEIRDIETNELTGYEVDGTNVPLDSNNRHYRKVSKLIEKGEAITPAFTEEERLEHFKTSRIAKLQNLSDSKTTEVKTFLAGITVSVSQSERYKIKYEEALKAIDSGDYSWFNAEATLTGNKSEDIANAVKTQYEEAIAKVNSVVAIIEAYRVKFKNTINDIDNIDVFRIVDSFLTYGEDLGFITEDKLVDMFNKYETYVTKLLNNEELKDEDIVWETE